MQATVEFLIDKHLKQIKMFVDSVHMATFYDDMLELREDIFSSKIVNHKKVSKVCSYSSVICELEGLLADSKGPFFCYDAGEEGIYFTGHYVDYEENREHSQEGSGLKNLTTFELQGGLSYSPTKK